VRLVPNWRNVLIQAWSIRLLVLAALLSAAEVALPFLRELMLVPPGLFAWLTIVATFSALIARLLAQKSIRGDE
jgi:hypothetical protein